MFASYVIAAWILIPISYYMGIWESDKYPIQSQTLWIRNGTKVSLSPLSSSFDASQLVSSAVSDGQTHELRFLAQQRAFR